MSGNWRKLTDTPEFVKWAYKQTPYRVVAHLGDRGHWEAIFTSVYDGPSYRIRGNCGGGSKGRMMATVAAQMWMDEHPYGCPPPKEMADEAGQLA